MIAEYVNCDYFVHLDYPREVPKRQRFPIQGWVISQFPVAKIWLEGQGQRIILAKAPRPDVAEAYPSYGHSVGFSGAAEISVLRGNCLSIGIGKAGGEILHDHLFLNMRVADLMGNPASYLAKEFVSGLTAEKNFELACTTMLIGEKRGTAGDRANSDKPRFGTALRRLIRRFS
jgi:hypothetical protein